MSWEIGQRVRLSCAFTVSNQPADPTAVTLALKNPSGITTTWTYALGQITKDSTGNYHKDVDTDASGRWYWRWDGTGAVVAVDEGSFGISPSDM